MAGKTRTIPVMVLILAALPAISASPSTTAQDRPRLVEYLSSSGVAADELSSAQSATLEAIRRNPAARNVQLGWASPDAVRDRLAVSLVLPAPRSDAADVVVSFDAMDIEFRSDDDYSLYSRDETTGSDISLVVMGANVVGTVRHDGDIYKVHPLGGGMTAVYHFDTRQLQEHDPDSWSRMLKEQVLREVQRRLEGDRKDDGATVDDGSSRLDRNFDDEDWIDVLVAYTARARSEAGHIDGTVRLAIEESNRIYANSAIRPRLRLVHSYQTEYTESSDMLTNLNRLRDGSVDSLFDAAVVRRNRYAADVVVLLVDNSTGSCGIARVNAREDSAFAVVAIGCATGFYSFAHEIGHLQGAHHNPEEDSNPYFAYGHGFCNQRAGWRTVMAYDTDDGRCRSRKQYFSSPSIRFRGTPTGDADARHNVRVLNETALRVANFRRSLQTPGGATHSLPLVIASGHPFQQGFVRVINHSDRAGTVRIRAVDDTGRRFRPISLSMPAKTTRHFNSDDLESGNSSKGLSGGVGNGTGNWWLEMESELLIEPLGYIRTDDRFVTSMLDVIAGDHPSPSNFLNVYWVYRVPFFNEGSHLNQSLLRLVNTYGTEAVVAIDAVDDQGSPGAGVRFVLPPRGACRISAKELESGSPRAGGCDRKFTGRLGDGTGKWHLIVYSSAELLLMNLMATPSGHLTNLSTFPSTGSDSRTPPPLPSEHWPDLEVQFPSVSDSNPHVGETVQLSVTIRNKGGVRSRPARLRFYRSVDPIISAADDEIPTTAPVLVNPLHARLGTSLHEIDVRLETPETTYFGACVQPVNEKIEHNNCSPGVRVTVKPPSGQVWGVIASGWSKHSITDFDQCDGWYDNHGDLIYTGLPFRWSATLNQVDHLAAVRGSFNDCETRGLGACSVRVLFDACGSLAVGDTRRYIGGGRSTYYPVERRCVVVGGDGRTPAEAEQDAIQICQSRGLHDCRVPGLKTTSSFIYPTVCNFGFDDVGPGRAQPGGIVKSLPGTSEPGIGSMQIFGLAGEVEVMDEPQGRTEIASGLDETALRGVDPRQAPRNSSGSTRTLPLVVASGHPFQQGFVRIINYSDNAGTVRIRAIDDSGRRFGPITLSLPANASRHFNSDDLERGNPTKGLTGGVGNGTGNWRIELESDLHIEHLAYVRTDDRFVTSMHDTVAGDPGRGYHVPFFNEGPHLNQSLLRLINPTDVESQVEIHAVDDKGRREPGDVVRFNLPPGAACRVGARELESGSTSGRCDRGFFIGGLGDGSGKWRLIVYADTPLLVTNLMATPSGHLTNLSTSPGDTFGTATPGLVWGAYALAALAERPSSPDDRCRYAWGLSRNRPSEADAENRARAACRVSGGGSSNCPDSSFATFRHCAAVVHASRHPVRIRECKIYGLTGTTRSDAERHALSFCRRLGFSDCAIAIDPSGERVSTCNTWTNEERERAVR